LSPLRDLGIFVDQAAEQIPAENADVCAESRLIRAPGRRTLL
jgi:hypothetical protein